MGCTGRCTSTTIFVTVPWRAANRLTRRTHSLFNSLSCILHHVFVKAVWIFSVVARMTQQLRLAEQALGFCVSAGEISQARTTERNPPSSVAVSAWNCLDVVISVAFSVTPFAHKVLHFVRVIRGNVLAVEVLLRQGLFASTTFPMRFITFPADTGARGRTRARLRMLFCTSSR